MAKTLAVIFFMISLLWTFFLLTIKSKLELVNVFVLNKSLNKQEQLHHQMQHLTYMLMQTSYVKYGQSVY